MSRDKKKQYKFLHLKKTRSNCNAMECFYEWTLLISSRENIMKNAMEQEKVSKIEIKDQYK